MSRNPLRRLKLSAILQERRNPRRPKRVVRKQQWQSRPFQPSLHHLQTFISAHRIPTHLPMRRSRESRKQRIIPRDPTRPDPVDLLPKNWTTSNMTLLPN